MAWIVDHYHDGNRSAAARRLDLSPEAVNNLYSGKSTPKGETLELIVAKYPRVNPVWLLTGTGPRERPAIDSADAYAEGLALAAQELRKIADQLDRRAGVRPAAELEAGAEKPTAAEGDEAGKQRAIDAAKREAARAARNNRRRA